MIIHIGHKVTNERQPLQGVTDNLFLTTFQANIYLFVCGLFNDAVSSSDNRASNVSIINE
jgi:hypothetical protein